MTDWPTHPDGTNKSIGEMTEEERRPLLRAAFLRSKIGELVPAWKDAFTPPMVGAIGGTQTAALRETDD